jgi:hypothetical protein
MSSWTNVGVITALICAAVSLIVAIYSSNEAYKLEGYKSDQTRKLEEFKTDQTAKLENVKNVAAANLEKFKNDYDRQRIEDQRRYEFRQDEEKYKEPLLRAAHELQSRLYNILKQNLLEVYLTNGDSREKKYVVAHTAFVISQFFCWDEITRKRIKFIDPERDRNASELLRLLDEITELWRTDTYPKPLRVFVGEQRAIGSAMAHADGNDCIDYAAFQAKLLPNKNELVEGLRADIETLPRTLDEGVRSRLVDLQHVLIDLLDLLDPNYVRFKQKARIKV